MCNIPDPQLVVNSGDDCSWPPTYPPETTAKFSPRVKAVNNANTFRAIFSLGRSSLIKMLFAMKPTTANTSIPLILGNANMALATSVAEAYAPVIGSISANCVKYHLYALVVSLPSGL
eukprot:m.9264 g.9264  ORF g.9264 m.9264 type:complete len:118 (-) comp4032_c0_seq1:187-540(-)